MNDLSNKREEILRCAHSLILAGGYNSFSYADISKVVGIRNASIHHHFPTKADLVRTLVTQYREGIQTGIVQLEQRVTNPLEKLRTYTAYWEACIADSSVPFCLCALLANEIPVLPEEVAFEVRSHFQWLSTWLVSVFEQGEKEEAIRLTDTAQVEAEIFMAAIHGGMLSSRAYGDGKVFGVIIHPLLKRLSP